MSSPLHDFPRRPQTPDAKPPSLDALNALRDASHCTGAGRSTRFVHDEPAGDASEGYEERTWRSGEVITRPDNWHDAFNALAWLAYPQTKRALNRLHHEHADSALSAAANARGVARDVLTLFDEDGLLVACADPRLAGLLKNFQWKELFWEQREAVARSMRFHVFGHALADKLRSPFRGLTAKALVFTLSSQELEGPPSEQVAALDARAAAWFGRPESLASTRVLSPLPVLGIPGWHEGNAQAHYYDDTWQFRPGRKPRGVHSTS